MLLGCIYIMYLGYVHSTPQPRLIPAVFSPASPASTFRFSFCH